MTAHVDTKRGNILTSIDSTNTTINSAISAFDAAVTSDMTLAKNDNIAKMVSVTGNVNTNFSNKVGTVKTDYTAWRSDVISTINTLNTNLTNKM